jgi:palmitoyltransferase
MGPLMLATFSAHPFFNIIFGLVFATSMYCFTQAVVSDPGYIPRPAGISEQKKIVEELVVRGEFDARHFCTSCFVRKSLRSKHCRICDRCVARHDQYLPYVEEANISHCPWVNNCVGVRTHRSFVTYVTLLEIGIPMFVYLAYLRIYPLRLG